MSELTYDPKPLTVQDLVHRFNNRRSGKRALNLEPGFQRRSVWQLSDRKKLIDSIYRGYPLPAIFLYKRLEDGYTIYDVIDGKQRIESILMFMGEIRGGRFSVRLPLAPDASAEEVDWRKLGRAGRQSVITDHTLQVIEIDGDLADVITLFVRINSTGKALTSAEKQHARFYSTSDFFKAAAVLAEQLVPILTSNGVLGDSQISRMKHVQLVSELMLSVHRGEPVHKKDALDAVMSSGEMTSRQIAAAVQRTRSAVKRTLTILPKIKATRFRKTSDFYSLVLLVAQLESKKLVLADRKRNSIARDLLTVFSAGVDSLNEKRRRAESPSPEELLYRDYLLTVLEGTDSYPNRKKRHDILCNLLEPIFEKLETKRLFSPEQRRILWNTTDAKVCKSCQRKLTWSDFTVDHINPYSKGGRTELANAALYCQPCNSRKGNRNVRRRAR